MGSFDDIEEFDVGVLHPDGRLPRQVPARVAQGILREVRILDVAQIGGEVEQACNNQANSRHAAAKRLPLGLEVVEVEADRMTKDVNLPDDIAKTESALTRAVR